MNRLPNTVLGTALFVSLLASPALRSVQTTEGEPSVAEAQEQTLTSSGAGSTSISALNGEVSHSSDKYRDKLLDSIAASCGNLNSAGRAPDAGITAKTLKAQQSSAWVQRARHLGATCNLRSRNILVATVPDPVHTHLAMLFDRDVDAIQQGIQDQNYVFDRHTLPWEGKPRPDTPNVYLRLDAKRYQSGIENQPGLIIFRQSQTPDRRLITLSPLLIVFLVAEQPTAGINREEFTNALDLIMALIQGGPETAVMVPSADNARVLRILGPSFTGSLPSLATLLHDGRDNYAETFIYSGTVTGKTDEFLTQLHPNEHFVPFLESDDIVIDRFIKFLVGTDYVGMGRERRYDAHCIALLTEDETAYGAGSPDAGFAVGRNFRSEQGVRCGESTADANSLDIVQVVFPRGISHLRAAYQAAHLGARDDKAPRTTLPLNLDVTGEDDAVSPYSKQAPLSQEAVMLGITSELRKHAFEYVLIRATDPLDMLFITQYLRTTFPSARIVTLGADLLFRREVEDARMQGVLSLSSYSLIPTGAHRYPNANGHFVDRIFPSADSIGIYNATRAMLGTSLSKTGTSRCNATQPNDCRTVLAIPKTSKNFSLYQYGWPDALLAEPAKAPSEPLRSYVVAAQAFQAPVVHLTVIGDDGYWPIAHLGPCPPASSEPKRSFISGVFRRFTQPLNDMARSAAGIKLTNFASDRADERLCAQTQLPQIPVVPAKFELPGSADSPQRSDTAYDLQFHFKLPTSWGILEFITVALALAFVFYLVTASVFSTSSQSAQFAPVFFDARAVLIAIIAFLFFCVLLILMYPFAHAREYMVDPNQITRHILLLAGTAAIVVVSTLINLASRYPTGRASHIRKALLILVLASLTIYMGVGMFISHPTFEETFAGIPQFGLLRFTQLGSGISAVVPIFFLLAAGLWWAFNVCSGCVFLDVRRPRLPLTRDCDARLAGIGEDAAQPLLRTLGLSCGPAWVIVGALCFTGVVFYAASGLNHSVHSLERYGYGKLVFGLVLLLVFCIVASALKLWDMWTKTRRLLLSLDSLPIRHAFNRLDGFSWKPLWSFGGSMFSDFSRILALEHEAFLVMINTCPRFHDLGERVSREWNSVEGMARRARLRLALPMTGSDLEVDRARETPGVEQTPRVAGPLPTDTYSDGTSAKRAVQANTVTFGQSMLGHAALVEFKSPSDPLEELLFVWNTFLAALKHIVARLRMFSFRNLSRSLHLADSVRADVRRRRSIREVELRLVEQFGRFQMCLADACAEALKFARSEWNEQKESAYGATAKAHSEESHDKSKVVPQIICCLAAPLESPATAAENKANDETECLRAAERFISVVYVSFLLVAVMRMRTLIVALGGMYIFLVLAMSSYPFEPRSAIQGLFTVLLIGICGMVVSVLGQMHRDSILSHLTDTRPGELGSDFWIRIVSFVALPVLGFFASQFPAISGVLYSWVQPALQSVK